MKQVSVIVNKCLFTMALCFFIAVAAVHAQSAPTVTTTAASTIGSVRATLGGAAGAVLYSPPVTEKGVVWALTVNPTTANNKAVMGAGNGSYSQLVTGLPGRAVVF